ncbi:MAG: hypothetical protein ABI616_02435 [Pseudomonadota bacterium]
MNDLSIHEAELDPASTARLPLRNTVLAQIEAALLAEKLSVTEAQVRLKGVDPYNKAPPKKDAWGHNR